MAVDEPKGGPRKGECSYDSPDIDLHIRSLTHLHMRSFTDKGLAGAALVRLQACRMEWDSPSVAMT